MGLFKDRTRNTEGKTQVPVWFMRQAGRYHDHYQVFRKQYDFMTMCKDSQLAHDITMGPIEEFDFDAAILFSDLLFPLEQLGMGLTYEPGPKLKFHAQEPEELNKLSVQEEASTFYKFQADALRKLRTSLPETKTLLGFVGAPYTLYTYAVEGSHKGNFVFAKRGLYNSLFHEFCHMLIPELLQNIEIQIQGGADAICLFDTAAGELSPFDYKEHIVPKLHQVTQTIKEKYPHIPLIYYSKHTNPHFLKCLDTQSIDVLGVDWRQDLGEISRKFSKDFYIQGNFDPIWLHLDWGDLKNNLESYWRHLQKEDVNFSKWICGLGHGVTVKTPQENVKGAVELIHDKFIY